MIKKQPANQEIVNTKPVVTPKSKRLSSFIWILVMWGLVRLVSEMDGLSWKRAFDGVSVMLGLWPATFFLGLSLLPYTRTYQTTFRWSAFAVVLGSFFGELVIFQTLRNDGKTDDVTLTMQWAVGIFVTTGVVIHWALKKMKK